MVSKIVSRVWIVIVMLAFCAGMPLASAAPEHEFVGSNKCAICHKKPEQGEQMRIWKESAHAKAIETLSTPAAKEAAAKLGISDPATSGKCLKCHSTAYYFTEGQVSSVIPVAEGVSCESCHGPGKDYMKKSIMESREESVKNGLVVPDEKTCTQCHNSESPTFKGFNYAEMWEKIKHPVPAK